MKDAKQFLITELGMSNIQAETMYDGYILACEKYATLKMIEENKSMLEMAERHMDSRAVLALKERILNLQFSADNKVGE